MAGGVTINGKDISVFGAKMLDFSVGGVSWSENYSFPPNATFPVRYQGRAGLRDITITLDFISDSWEACELAASNLYAELAHGADLTLPDGFGYFCILQQGAAPKRPAGYITTHTIRFLGVRRGALVSETLAASGNVFVSGNKETPVRLTVEGINGTVEIMGITVSGLTGTVIIDGIARTATQNGLNVFGNTNLTSFPTLLPGENSVNVPDGCTVTVEYYPIYA